MNPTNDTALPFFMQYLETQVIPGSEDPDTTSVQSCNWPGTLMGGWCIMDTKKYPSDGDDSPTSPGL
ncbi:MAG TPA: microviridin/marinostatin family tricyclic proteinase inhibitor [Myxococcota bacterium]|nr:microviridin/marinostatin family tricyclic proteinase inhibitor [Myxococcota bacterium]